MDATTPTAIDTSQVLQAPKPTVQQGAMASGLGAPKSRAQIEAAAKDFESVFATQMLTHMYAGIKPDTEFGGGSGEDMFRTLTLDEYGKQIGRNDSFGIAKSISDTMLKIQEQANGNH